jgi:hypothetical protein
MRWTNFSIWRGKLPHWRADDVRYYVTFRHRRSLDEFERALLFRQLLRPEGRKWNLLILCVLPDATEFLFTVESAPGGRPYELSDVVERAKKKAGAEIVRKSGERFPPFYTESYDRIIRDEAELAERWEAIFQSPAAAGIEEGPDGYATLFVSGAP